MGQKIGRVELIDSVESFTNLPRRAILNMWQCFNNIADGFGINVDEVLEICADLKDELNVSRQTIDEKSSALFNSLDTDNNGLIDALEFFSVISTLSGMRKLEILDFILTIYDFDGTLTLSMDEVVLALKSAAVGLCKLQRQTFHEIRDQISYPKEELIEQIVSSIFISSLNTTEVTDLMRINIKTLCALLNAHPDVGFWFNYFSAPKQHSFRFSDLIEQDKDFETENPTQLRSHSTQTALDWDVRSTLQSTLLDAIKNPWISSIAMLTPIEYSTQVMKTSAPNSSVTPEWIYGYQCERSKNNLFYNFQGDVVYTISKYAIVYNFASNKQNIFTGHSEEILCLKMHPNKQLVASGEAGPTPRLIVWHSETKKVLFYSRDFHRNGIIHVSFSPDGHLLASIGNDSMQSIRVCRWEDNIVLFNSPVNADRCLSLTIASNNTIVVAGESYIYFWSKSLQGYVKRNGLYSRYADLQPITAMEPVYLSENIVTGTATGQLFLWVDINCVRTVKAHSGTINCIYSCPHGILSGGRDQKIRMWTANLEPSVTFDVSNYGTNPIIRGLCLAEDGTSILLGTRGSNIYEISAIDGSDCRGGPVAVGHSVGTLTSLTCHPSKFEFITVGLDRTLRVFDMSSKTQLKIANFDGDATIVTYSPLGVSLVVGFGGAGSTKSGTYMVLNEEDLSVLHEARDTKHAVTTIAFSQEGETLAIGCEDGSILLYAVQEDYDLIGKCIRHKSRIIAIDFSSDGEWLRSNSIDKELCFFNADDASYQSNIASMRDIAWATNSCIYTWHVKALHFSPFEDESVICNNTPTATSNYLACGSNIGYIRLHVFPCAGNKLSECHRYPAHVNEVAALKFSFDSNRLLTIGLQDRSIIQWNCSTYELPEIVVDPAEAKPAEDLALEIRDELALKEEFMPDDCDIPVGKLNSSIGDIQDVPSTPENDIWINSVVDPTVPSKQNQAVPDMSLMLEHVYGYESQTMRNNVRYNKSGEIIYTTATLGVVMNLGNKSQNIYKYHTDAITSFASSSDGSLVATGQMGYNPIISIWESKYCKTKFIVPEIQKNSVSCLAFSKDDEYLAVVSNDEGHTISIYDWKANFLVSKAYAGSNFVIGVCFTDNDYGLVTYGVKEIRIWKNIKSRFPICFRALLGEIGTLQIFLTCDVFNGQPNIGTSDGNLYIFEGSNPTLKHVVKAHNGAVNALHSNALVSLMVSGGKDGAIRLWNKNHECIKEYMVDSILSLSHGPRVRSVAFSNDGSHIIVGTRGSEIFEISANDGKLVGGKPLVESHGMRQLWALSSHPIKDEFVTSGDDATIRVWNTKQRAQIKSIKIDTGSRAICYSPDGNFIAVGFGSDRKTKGKLPAKEGAYVILRSNDLKIVHEGKDSNNFIRVVKYSPDMKTFAVGSDDTCIYLYDVKDQYSKRVVLKCHAAPIHSIDFSIESTYIMSVDSTKRICFTDNSNGIHIPTPALLRDEKWSTLTSPVSWSVKGFWLSQPKNAEVCTAQKSWGGSLVAVGNTAGSLFLAHNPCPSRAGFLKCSGHAGRISQLAWSAGDVGIISCGLNDHSILQWRCVFDNSRESGDEGGKSCDDSEIEQDAGNQLKLNEKFLNPTKEVDPIKWLTMIAPPSNLVKDNTDPMNTEVALDFVQGLRINDVRQSVKYNEDGNIVYIASTFGIIFLRNEVKQIFYQGHRNALISLDLNVDGKIAATGEYSENPEVHIWDAKTGEFIKKFQNIHSNGVSSLSFSKSTEYLVSLGQDSMNSVAIFFSPTKKWNDGYYLCSSSVSSSKMLWSLYVDSNEFPIIIGGKGSIYFFRVVRGINEKVKGVYGKRIKIQPILCGIEGDVPTGGGEEKAIICGTVSGHLYVFSNYKVTDKVSAHEGSVTVIARCQQGYVSGGKEGMVKIWSHDFKVLHTYRTSYFVPRPYGLSCHAVATNKLGTNIIIGMRSDELFEVSLMSNSTSLLIDGHSILEQNALDVNPQNPDEYVTGGDDGVIRVWSISRRYCLRKVMIDFACRAICWSPDGNHIVVGIGGVASMASKDGSFTVLDAKSLEILREERKAKMYITDMKFSLTTDVFAVGCADGRVYLHNSKTYEFMSKIETSGNCVVSKIDFSADGDVLRIGTNLNELFFYSFERASLLNNGIVIKDVSWQSNSCPFSWNTQGVFRRDGSDIQVIAVAVHPSNKLVVASYDNGSLRAYRYPCQSQQMPYVSIPGVCTKASRLCFTADGKYLIVIDSLVRTNLHFSIKHFM